MWAGPEQPVAINCKRPKAHLQQIGDGAPLDGPHSAIATGPLAGGPIAGIRPRQSFEVDALHHKWVVGAANAGGSCKEHPWHADSVSGISQAPFHR